MKKQINCFILTILLISAHVSLYAAVVENYNAEEDKSMIIYTKMLTHGDGEYFD